MTNILGRRGRIRGLFADIKGPWGTKSGSGGGADGDPPSGAGDGADDRGNDPGPWGQPAQPGQRGRRSPGDGGNVASLEDFLRRGRARFGNGGSGGGGGSGLSGLPNRAMILWGLLGLIAVWLVFTSFHSIAPGQRGVVSQFGRYSATLGPGVSLTLPSPIDRVTKLDVENIRSIDLGSDAGDDLMITGDQNLIDIAYSVRWNIRTPELYLYEMAEPDDTIREVAESAMRSVVSQVSLDDAMGDKRAAIEFQVAETMQRILDAYRSGVQVQGIAIKQADPPDAVNDAFKEVTAAQQDAQSYLNQARAYAVQLTAKAQGEATAFDKVYEEYRLAPEVTRRRMYYETMEQVLSKVDKTIVEVPGGVTSYLPLPQLQRSQPAPQPQREPQQ